MEQSDSKHSSLDIKLPAAGKSRKGVKPAMVKPVVLPPPRIKGAAKSGAVKVKPVQDAKANRAEELEKELTQLKANYDLARKRLADLDPSAKKGSGKSSIDWVELESLEGREMPVQANNDVIHAETKLYAEIENLKSQLAEKDEAIASLKHELNEKPIEVALDDDSSEELAELKGQIEQLRKTIAEKDEHIRFYEKKVQDAEASVDELQHQIKASESTFKTELKAASDALKEAEARLSNLPEADLSAEEMAEKDAWIAELESKLEQKEKALAALKSKVDASPAASSETRSADQSSPRVTHALPAPKVDGPPLFDDIQKKLDDLQNRCRTVLGSLNTTISSPESDRSSDD
jgi:DNA repair exonuclease SbcCD ATPase subunit